jgi:WD40 repeat protein
VQRLCDDLREDLGPQGFAWLAACAAYPEIHWGLTLRLGATLVPDARALEGLLPRLARLVWFREAFMPDWLREALLDRLEPAEEDLARVALDALLSGLLETSGDLPLRIALSAPRREQSWPARLRRSLAARRIRAASLLREAPPDSPLRDHVFLSFVSGRRHSKIDPLAPARLLRDLRRGARHWPWTPAGALLLSLLATTLLASRLPLARLDPYEVGDVAVSFLADGSVLAVTSGAYDTPDATEAALSLVHWRSAGGRWSGRRQPLGALAVVDREARPVAMNSTGTRVAWVQPSGRIAAWDVGLGQAIGPPRATGEAGAPARLALSPDGRWLLAGNDGGTSLWDLADDAAPARRLLAGRPDGTVVAPRARTLAFSPDSTAVAVADGSGETMLWSLRTDGRSTGPAWVGVVEGSGAAFGPDSRTLATADGQAIRLWAIQSLLSRASGTTKSDDGASEMRRIDWPGTLALGVFSPDGRLLAAVGSDETVVIWEVSQSRRVGTPVPAGNVFPAVAFNAGSDQIVVGGRSDGTTIWRVPRYPVVTIPVVVHVVYATSEQNISKEQIDSQLVVLNADFRAKNADLSQVPEAFRDRIGDAAIEFRLAKVDPDGQPTQGITRTRTKRASFEPDNSVKHDARGGKDAWPTTQYLNIWVAPLQGVLGYSAFPGDPSEMDGVVIDYRSFGTIGTAEPPRNGGRAATALIARYLNVRHIWGDDMGCQGTDSVDDTPNQAGPNYGKPTFPHVTCDNGPTGDMFMNFADYTDDDTMVMFTKGQVARMRAALDGPRSGLLAPLVTRPPAAARNVRAPVRQPAPAKKY